MTAGHFPQPTKKRRPLALLRLSNRLRYAIVQQRKPPYSLQTSKPLAALFLGVSATPSIDDRMLNLPSLKQP